MRVGKIKRFARCIDDWIDWHAHAIGVRNDANAVLQIETARLLRDVAAREVLALEAFEIAALGLADHLTGAVVRELINHHAVVAEQPAKQSRRAREEFVKVFHARSSRDQRAGKIEWAGDGFDG